MNQEKIYKSRLVCRGYQKRYGIDYFEIYASVVRMAALRTMLAISMHKKRYIIQMDVKTVFLNGVLEENIFLEQPEGFITERNYDYVCQLQRAIYGLQQTP